MTAYVPALIWLISAVICLWIARSRRVKKTAFRAMVVAVLGPVAIPWVMVMRPEEGQSRLA